MSGRPSRRRPERPSRRRRTASAPGPSLDERLQKILGAAGIASRRRAETLIREGRVTVNGVVVRRLGVRADAARDRIAVDGEPIGSLGPRRTIVLHKPRGVVSTLADPEGRPTVRSLLGGVRERLYPVGRLDVNTTGLLLLTNDGALAAGLLHPRRAVPRVYHAKVRGTPPEEALSRLRRGVRMEEGRSPPAGVRVLERLPTKTWLEVTVAEGRRHLVRRMLAAVGHPIEKLGRVRLGPLTLGALPPAAWRDLRPGELAALYAAAGISEGRPGGGGGGARGERRRAGGRPPRRSRERSESPPPDGRRDRGSRAPAARQPGARRRRRRPRS